MSKKRKSRWDVTPLELEEAIMPVVRQWGPSSGGYIDGTDRKEVTWIDDFISDVWNCLIEMRRQGKLKEFD